jgi:hypothetical protein
MFVFGKQKVARYDKTETPGDVLKNLHHTRKDIGNVDGEEGW